MAPTLTRIDGREFDRLADQTSLGETAREMARLVLVEGKTMPDVGRLYGHSKQRVALAVNRIREIYQGTTTRTGWVRLDAEMPVRLSTLLEEWLAAYKESQSADARSLAMRQLEHALERAKLTLRS